MKNLIKYAFIAFMSLAVASCNNDDDNTTSTSAEVSIAGFVADNPDYSTLLSALDRAGLVATLDGNDDFTVFAPNNTAFEAFLNVNGFASLEDVPVDVLTNILLNHVVSGTVTSTQLSTGYIN